MDDGSAVNSVRTLILKLNAFRICMRKALSLKIKLMTMGRKTRMKGKLIFESDS